MEKLDKNVIRMIAGRDQAMSFIRDNQQLIVCVANTHPDPLIKGLAYFALAEYVNCPDISFTKVVEDGS